MFVTRRRYREELAAANAEANRQRERAEKAIADQATAAFNREQVVRQFAEADKQLTAARKQIADPDVHRKALAIALGAGPDRTWEQLLDDTARLTKTAAQRAAEIAGLNTHLARARADVVALSGELADGREARRPIDGGSSKPRTESDELRQAKAHASALAAQLATITTANLACTCGGGKK
ncbi:hypothetical protein [Streptomyces sp. NPDC001315]|uniref:hypothetical protein n=1 Tax=Streptomyces sp. NPDC001315 TaxID=3364562 RepID=UPI00368D103B